jgi:hypothetical protein
MLHAIQVGLNFDDVRMAVLVQRVVPAQYAFVIHTRNPSNNDANEVFCELVQGLGESLVSGMIAGSAVAFKANKQSLDNPETLCYASKSEGMFVRESLIFRSDSNGEDLEGYAGKMHIWHWYTIRCALSCSAVFVIVLDETNCISVCIGQEMNRGATLPYGWTAGNRSSGCHTTSCHCMMC